MSNQKIAKKDAPITISILSITERGDSMAMIVGEELSGAEVYTKGRHEGAMLLSSVQEVTSKLFGEREALIYIGALGICTRAIAPYVADKHTDPAILCIDTTGRFVIPVLSGHVGGANALAQDVARIIGAEAILTTQSDNEGLWALDTLDRSYGWKVEPAQGHTMNDLIFAFVGGKPTALLLEIRDRGTEEMERTRPEHVKIFYHYEDINPKDFDLLIAVTHRRLPIPDSLPTLLCYPQVLTLGVGCRKDCDPSGVWDYIRSRLTHEGLAPRAIRSISTIELKSREPLISELSKETGRPVEIFSSDELAEIDTPSSTNPLVREVTGSGSVSEASAIRSAGGGRLLLPKVKGKLSEGNDFTFAVALLREADRQEGHIEIVGAGPGDPELVSVRGKRFLGEADLILYAGSLVPRELTHYAKEGAVVRSSAGMNLEEQFQLMKNFYDRGLLVVRLHTGDPSIYGAIQEQMALFDREGMQYHITPGISSFQAAAAELQSEFTIPEKVQTIILTRGEGRTAMPEREKLHLLARSRSTMCIYLSALLADEVQSELLTEYPPETPVAICHKLTWKGEQKIIRGTLDHLSELIKENDLKLTTLIVVGEAIGNRKGLSRLYADEFKHLFRK